MKPNRVAIIGADWPVYELFCPNFTGMQQGLKELGIEHRLFSCRPQLDFHDLVRYEPDLVIYGLIDMAKDRLMRMRIKEALPDARIVMWYGDLRNEETGQCQTDMSEIDMMFVSNDAQSDFYKEMWRVPECHFLPLGSPIYSPEYDPKLDFDFVFIGGLVMGKGFADRADTMWKFKDLGLRIIDAPASKPELRAKVLEKMPSVYRSSKVILDQSHFTDIKGYTSNRFWIITASGGFALTKRWPGCEEFYPKGTRVYFDTFDEAIRLRDYYLEHPDERERIRLAGYRHAINHTYARRFDKMFEKLYASKKNKINNARHGPRDESLPSGA